MSLCSSASSLESILDSHSAGLGDRKQAALGAPSTAVSWSRPTQPVKITASTSGVTPQVADNPFHLIPRQSEDFPVCVDSSRDPSPVDSSSSSWVELSSRGARSGRSGDEDSTGTSSIREKIRSLKRTVALSWRCPSPQCLK